MRYLTATEVIAINAYLIAIYSPNELNGVKEPTLLDSAVHRPEQSAFGKDAYVTLFEKAAALFESIAQNHCFHNANKRTAVISLAVFIGLNGHELTFSNLELENFVVDFVNHRYSFDELVDVIERFIERA